MEMHDLNNLVVFAGLWKEMQLEKHRSTNLFKAWNKVTDWKVDRRYELPPSNPIVVNNFMLNVKTVFKWIEMHW